MGLNPFRPQHNSMGDYLMVAAAVIACIVLIAWAVSG